MAIKLTGPAAPPKSASISMAPMIDMVFLLLVFFMTASAMSQAGSKLELELPESGSAKVAQDFSNRLIVSVGADGEAYIGSSPVNREELLALLESFATDSAGGRLSIRAAKSTPFSAVREVMELAARAGIVDYLYASYEASGE